MMCPSTDTVPVSQTQGQLGEDACGLLVLDEWLRVRICNVGAARMLRKARDGIVGQSLAQVLPSLPFAELDPVNGRGRFILPVPGEEITALCAVCETQQWDGRPALIIELHVRTNRDIAHPGPDLNRFQAQADRSENGVCVTDRDGTIVYANAALAQQSGYSVSEIIGSTPRLFRSGVHPPSFYARLWETLLAGQEFSAVFINRHKSGALFYEKKRIRPFISANNCVSHFVATGRDISQNLVVLEKLEYLANHDGLTGLPNRSLFRDRLHREFIHAGRYGGGFAVCYVDVDQLKPVNDLHGHAAGDTLLQALARTLSRHLRREDTVARLGGDEFGLILKDVATAKGVRTVLTGLMRALKSQGPLDCGPGLAPLSVSIGISLYPRDGEDEATLMLRADLAMYRAKARGGAGFRFYSRRLDGRGVKQAGKVEDDMVERRAHRRAFGQATEALNPDLLYYLNLIDPSL